MRADPSSAPDPGRLPGRAGRCSAALSPGRRLRRRDRLTALLAPYADQFPVGAAERTASRCGTGSSLAAGAARAGRSSAVGLLLFVGSGGVRPGPVRAVPRRWSAERGYHGADAAAGPAAVEVTGVTQRGSLPVYLGSILLVVVLLPGAALLAAAAWPATGAAWDNAGQVVVGGDHRRRRGARRPCPAPAQGGVLVGVTGYGTAMLFLLHGAPDLALTQVLVETVTLVVFVLVLRRLPEYFTDRPLHARGATGGSRSASRSAVVVAGVMPGRHRCPDRHAGLGGLPDEAVARSAAAATSST